MNRDQFSQLLGGRMNTYEWFYRGKKGQVNAETSYEAQQKAAKELKAKKAYDVAVVLVEKDGAEVKHTGAELP
jgi:hypothetical protein